jgi:predicted nucleic acid-binding protein
MIVADTSLIARLWLRDRFTPLVEQVFLSDPDWAAPLLWRSEFRNALVCFHRAGRLSLERMVDLYGDAEVIMEGREYTVRPHKVLQFAARTQASAYDSEYAVLADDFGVRLLTLDSGLLAHFPELALHPADFLKRN